MNPSLPHIDWNPQLSGLPVYQPGRPIEDVARELGLEPANIIKLASNENPLGPSPLAVEAMAKAARSMHLYPDGGAFHLRARLAEALEVDPNQLVFGNGSNEVLELVAHALLRPGVNAVVSEHAFAVYPIVTRLMGADLIQVPAKKLGHDLPAMRAAITPDTRVVFVANPNNPTGTLADRGEVIELINELPDHVLLVMDEAYIEYLEHPLDLLPLIRRKDPANLLLTRTFSKIHGLAGLRLGYGIGHPEVISRLESVREPFNVNLPAQAAGCAAIEDLEHVQRSRANNQEGLRVWTMALRKMGLHFVPTEANFLLVEVGNGQEVFLALQSRGVITRPVGAYGLPTWLRISIGSGRENQKAIEALGEIMTQRQQH